MQDSGFWQKRTLGIRRWELCLLVLFYLIFGLAYNMAIYMSSNNSQVWLENVALDYSLKALFTLPIWWLLFKRLSNWQLWKKVLLHFFFLPIFVVVWRQVYYLICDATGLSHLSGPGAWWDIYIPGLFYVLQFGIFHVYDYYHKLQEQQKMESELRQAALKMELTALKAQLNPHFLYNTFNTISASVPSELESTREMIAKLADLFRYQLEGSSVELIPLQKEITFVQKYLELEKERFGERLQFQFELGDEVNNALVPPMILQPLVENAVKHGVSPKIEGGLIQIKIERQGNLIHFQVCDSGVGLAKQDDPFGKGVGLTNTQLRLEKMYQTKLELHENEGGGICVHFQIPYSSAAHGASPEIAGNKKLVTINPQ